MFPKFRISVKKKMVAVGFEPTPSRTSALNWRLGPLGQTTLLKFLNIFKFQKKIQLNHFGNSIMSIRIEIFNSYTEENYKCIYRIRKDIIIWQAFSF